MSSQKENSQLYPEQSASNLLYRTLILSQKSQQLDIHWSYLSPRFLLAFRVLALAMLTWRWAIEKYVSAFMILEYLTQLGFNTTWMYFTLVLFDLLVFRKANKSICAQFSSWVNLLFELAFCFEFPITIIYWMVLFDYNVQHTSWEVIRDFGVHGFPLVCLAIDFIFNVYVFPLKHIAILFVYGILYALINLGYSLATVPVYDPIDWVSLPSYGLIACCLIVVVVVHRGSDFVWAKLKQGKVKQMRKARFNEMEVSNQDDVRDLL